MKLVLLALFSLLFFNSVWAFGANFGSSIEVGDSMRAFAEAPKFAAVVADADSANPEEVPMAEQALDKVPDKNSLQTKDKKVGGTVEALTDALSETKSRRQNADYFALLNYSPIDMLLPSKLGASFGWNSDVSKTYELEYLHSGISASWLLADFGSMSDDRISIMARSYASRNSFQFSYGLTYFDFSLHVGDQLLSRLTSATYPSIDLVQIQSLGFNLGLGNRWTFQHDITFGIDWISWAQPLYTLSRKAAFLDVATNSQDRDLLDRAMKLISYLPRFSFLKLQLGILF